MAGFLDSLIGNAADIVGTTLNLPDRGWSEMFAGGETANTGRIPYTGQQGTKSAQTVQNAYFAKNPMGTPEDQAKAAAGIDQGGVLAAQNANNQLGGGVGGGGAVGGPSQGLLNSLLQQAGQGIQQGYDATMGQLRSNADFLRQQSGDLVNQADTIFNQQKGGFERQRTEAMSDLDRSQREIESNKQDAFSDLSSDLRAQMESFARMIGAMGAADSSASGMGQYAYGRMGQQARSDIWKQANQLMSEVGVRREKVNNLFQENLRQLADWKTNQLTTIENDFKAKNQQIEQAKMQADAARIAQLNDIQMQIQQQAMTTALQVDQRVAQIAQSNQQWARQQAQNLDGLKSQMQQSLQALGLDPVAVDPMASTAVNNNFAFGAGDIQRNSGGPGAIQVALPQNRRDDENARA